MLGGAIRKYKKMILASIFFFYLGCGLTVSLLRLECAEGARDVRHRAAAASGQHRSSVEMAGVEYVVLVLSSPFNEQKRDAIRMTWGNFVDNVVTDNGERLFRWTHTRSDQRSPPNYIKILFAVGTQGLSESLVQKLGVEAVRTSDLLLLENLEDSYELLADKMVASVRWLYEHANQLKYLIKCDDDSFVRVDLIVSELDASGHRVNVPQLRKEQNKIGSYKGLYWGYFDGRARAYLSGKWKEEDWFLCDNYLPYALGGGYVVSSNIVAYVANNADVLRRYKSEDVSMGVWTGALDGINRIHDIRFDTQWKSRGCQNDILVRHKQTPSDMFTMYNTLVQSRGKALCKSESIDRKPYQYNWSVLPSMCCK